VAEGRNRRAPRRSLVPARIHFGDRQAAQCEHPAPNCIRLESSVSQPVRHTDARRLAQSGAGEDDRPIARQLVEPLRNLVGWDLHGALEADVDDVVPPDVDEERSVSDQLARFLGIDSARGAPNGRRYVVSARGRGHAHSLCADEHDTRSSSRRPVSAATWAHADSGSARSAGQENSRDRGGFLVPRPG
jgi:hypothetical protein